VIVIRAGQMEAVVDGDCDEQRLMHLAAHGAEQSVERTNDLGTVERQ